MFSTRTPEGEPNHCFLCRKDVVLEPSLAPGRDAPCPHCGQLLWFPESGFKVARCAGLDLDDFVGRFEDWIERSGSNVVLDFAGVDLVGSLVLGKLISLHRKLGLRGGKLTIVNVSKLNREVFEITKLNTLFDIAE